MHFVLILNYLQDLLTFSHIKYWTYLSAKNEECLNGNLVYLYQDVVKAINVMALF